MLSRFSISHNLEFGWKKIICSRFTVIKRFLLSDSARPVFENNVSLTFDVGKINRLSVQSDVVELRRECLRYHLQVSSRILQRFPEKDTLILRAKPNYCTMRRLVYAFLPNLHFHAFGLPSHSSEKLSRICFPGRFFSSSSDRNIHFQYERWHRDNQYFQRENLIIDGIVESNILEVVQPK